MAICETVLDHEYGPETIVGVLPHPVLRQVLKVERRCDHCGRVQRYTRPGSESPAYTASADRVGILGAEAQ